MSKIPNPPASAGLPNNIPPGGIEDEDDAPEQATSEVVTLVKRAKIILEESDEIPPTGLFVGLNGEGFMIKPGFEVSVPAGVLGILEDARAMHPMKDPTTLRYLGSKPRPRFAFQVIFDPRPNRGKRLPVAA